MRPSLSPEHRMRIGAGMLGLPLEQYRAHVVAGEKWCSGHKAWEPAATFSLRISKPDGRDSVCRDYVNARARATMKRLYWQRKLGAAS